MMYGDRQMLFYKYHNSFYKFMSNQKEVVINEKNADWHLFQIGRDLSLVKGIYEQKRIMKLIDISLPKSLSFNEKDDYNSNDIDLFVSTLASLIHYLESSEKPLRIEQENTRTVIENVDQRIREAKDESTKGRYETQRMKLITDLNRCSMKMVHFVNDLMKTKIKIEDNEILVFSPDDELLQFMSNELTSKGKKMITVTQESANHW